MSLKKSALATLLAAGLLLAAAIPAQAGTGNTTFDFSFGSPGTGAGQLDRPSGVAVNQTTGEVYVADRSNHRVQRFDAAGNFISTWGLDVDADDPSTGFEVCTAASGHACQAGTFGGTVRGALANPTGIGVDSAGGAVYVQDSDNFRVQRFSAEGDFELMWGKGVNLTDPTATVCPRPGNPGDTCVKGTSSGDSETTPITPSGKGVFFGWDVSFTPLLTVGPDGNVYVGEQDSVPDGRVQKFGPGGAFLGMVAPPAEQGTPLGPQGLAVNTSGDLYITSQGASSGNPDAGAIFNKNPKVVRFDSSQFTPDGLTASGLFFAERSGFGIGHNGAALDPANEYLFTVSTVCGFSLTVDGLRYINEFHPDGQAVDCTAIGSPVAKGIAVSADGKLYLAIGGASPEIQVFDVPTADPPEVTETPTASEVTTSKVRLDARIAGNLDDTTFHVEYGTAGPCDANPCTSTPESDSIGASFAPELVTETLTALQPDTTYHSRIVATNGEGSDASPDVVFRTYPEPLFDPTCPNNLARQQTGAAFLLDCRAYELVSAPDQGGYDVESDLAPGGQPFAAYPAASDSTLYGIHNGGIPGVGKPTNRGVDPYLASRDEPNQRWLTDYVGIPADAPSAAPFSSTLGGADEALSRFAFSGSDLCDPCFADGSSGIPIRTSPGGPLEQGMSGSIAVPFPEPAGGVRKHFSPDGSHFLFSSTQRFEPQGNSNGTDATIYDRDLEAGTTEVVSTMPNGDTIAAGTDVRALDISPDGSRVVIGVVNSTDSQGNELYDLYLHEGGSPNSREIVSGGAGALYAGMTDDGSQLFFTSRENLDDDTDASADLFRAAIDGGVTIERVSTGTSGAGDTDACDPSANSANPENWNTAPGGPTDCSVLAVGGGAGVAPGTGAVYFLSPEQLDGGGRADEPNLFAARPGEDPQLVATLESDALSPIGPDIPKFHGYTGSFTKPWGAAIDDQDDSFYVYDVGNTSGGGGPGPLVHKFNADGSPDLSYDGDGVLDGSASGTAFQSIADPTDLAGFGLTHGAPTGIAVDNYPASPSYGDLYVPSANFSTNTYEVLKFDSDGNYLASLSPAPNFFFPIPTAVAVDGTTGNVYIGMIRLLGGPRIRVFNPDGSANGPASFNFEEVPVGIGVDSTGKVYVATGEGGVSIYEGKVKTGTLDSKPAEGVTVDPSTDHIYVDRGNQVVEYDADGNLLGTIGTTGFVTDSVNLAVTGGQMVVSNPGAGNVAFFDHVPPSDPAYDHPLVLDSVRSPYARRSADLQLSADGETALFPSTQLLDPAFAALGFDSNGRTEVYRHDAGLGETECLSCNTTNETPTTDASLATNGSSLTEDGRIFFNTGESLSLRDTNEKQDVYEWKAGKLELISTGQSRADSSLLGVSSEGTDAFFFTRSTLAEQDTNGPVLKLYTARENGGFFVVPPPPPCRASDECHGQGSEPAAPIDLGTLQGSGGDFSPPLRCNAAKLGRRAKGLSRRAKRLRRRAKAVSRKKMAPARKRRATRRYRRRARRLAAQAKETRGAAKRCRAQAAAGRSK